MKYEKLYENPTDEQLQEQHRLYISGSQVGEILNRPWDNLRRVFGEEPIDNPYRFSKNSEENMLNGILQEPYILAMGEERYTLLSNVKTDKATYKLKDLPFTFNLDAYIGKDINHVETIIEIKSTSDKDLSNAKKKGWLDQMKFYCLCTGARKAILLGLCASRLKMSEFNFSDAEIEELKNQLLDYNNKKIEALLVGDYTILDHTRHATSKDLQVNEIVDETELNQLKIYEELCDEYKSVKEKIDEFKDNLKTKYGVSEIRFNDKYIKIYETTTTKIDYENLCNYILEKTSYFLTDKELNQFKNTNVSVSMSPIKTIKIKKGK